MTQGLTGSPVPARRLLQEGTQRLQAAGLQPARREAEWLLGRLLGQPPTELYLRDAPVPGPIADTFLAHVGARAGGAPLQYLLGEAEFFGRTFAVRPGVFIPRPETEVVVEAALTRLRALAQRLGRPLRLLDVGTGSGCIAVTLARALPACAVVGIEVSWGALQVAAANARRHGVSERVHWVHGRGLEPFSPGARFDGLLSNPPYVPSGLVQQLPLDVRREPSESLDGGPDGMRELVGLLGGAPQLLNPGGVMALECGEDQAEPLLRAARGARWAAESAALGDLTGRPRGVLIVRAWTNS